MLPGAEIMDLNFSTPLDSSFSRRDSSLRVLTGCFLSVLILSTLLGNTLVCAAVTKFRHLRSKVTNFFVISLAVSDLLVAILVMPWKAVTEIAGFWPFGSFCSVWVACDIMCSTASILNLCVISVDRYWAISSPFRYERKMTPKVAFVMISVAWALSLLISFIPVQLNWHKAQTSSISERNKTVHGDPVPANCDSRLNRTYAVFTSVISFYIPVAIMIVTYTRIYRIAQKQIRRISALERAAESAKNRHSGEGSSSNAEAESSFKTSFRKETKVLKTLSVIIGVFVCCWLPFFILNCTVPFCEQLQPSGPRLLCVSSTTFNVFVWFGWANSSLNPVIYAFNTDFRRAFSILLSCPWLCPRCSISETVGIDNGAPGWQGRDPTKACASTGHTPNDVLKHTMPLSLRGLEEELQSRREEELQSRLEEELQSQKEGELQSRREEALQSRREEELQSRREEALQSRRESAGVDAVALQAPASCRQLDSQANQPVEQINPTAQHGQNST